MSDDKELRCHVAETGESTYAVRIDTSGHILTGDEPVASGGANLGPAPYDVLLAALGECTAMTIRWYAQSQDWPLEKVAVNLTHSKQVNADGKGKKDYFTKEIHLTGEKLTSEQRAKLHDVAAKCPVQRTLEGTPVIKTIKMNATAITPV